MVLQGRRSRQVRVKLYSAPMLLVEWSMTLSMTSQGSEGDRDGYMAGEFEGARQSEAAKSAKGHRGRDQGRQSAVLLVFTALLMADMGSSRKPRTVQLYSSSAA